MEITCEKAVLVEPKLDTQASASSQQQKYQQDEKNGTISAPAAGENNAQAAEKQQQPKTKRKHRRGKPKAKNSNKPYKKTNWKFQIPRVNYNYKGGNGGGNNGGSNGSRAKLARSRSLVPYNTNKFLMEEHLADVPSALLTPSGRTRDSSFSVDSDDNYFYSLPEDEEEFLTKEFDNIYEKARVERLENLTKQQLIEECLQIEDRYSTDQGTQRQHQLNVQRISTEFMTKIRVLEDKVRELTRENFDLRGQLMRSAALAAAAAASPPSAAAPTGSACQPTPMDSASEDSESDSTSTSSSAASSASFNNANNAINDVDDVVIRNHQQHDNEEHRCGARGAGLQHYDEQLNDLRSGSSSRSSLSEYNAAVLDQNQSQAQQEQLLGAHMEEDEQSNKSNDLLLSNSSFVNAAQGQDSETCSAVNLSPSAEAQSSP